MPKNSCSDNGVSNATRDITKKEKPKLMSQNPNWALKIKKKSQKMAIRNHAQYPAPPPRKLVRAKLARAERGSKFREPKLVRIEDEAGGPPNGGGEGNFPGGGGLVRRYSIPQYALHWFSKGPR